MSVTVLYRCCDHCVDDSIHDVPKDGHDLPCGATWPTPCVVGQEVAA